MKVLTEDRPQSTPAAPPSAPRRMWALVRNSWRGLVSMRTALVLLFLLALGAIPGALLPQRSLNVSKVNDYIGRHSFLGPIFNKVGLFEVFASPWFAAIYVLLFVSLVGCIIPRLFDHLRALRSQPVAAPHNLSRLPHYQRTEIDADVEATAELVQRRLKRWRTIRRSGSSSEGATTEITISAERGYLREAGNLVFHLSLVGLLIGIAAGKLFGYEGQVIMIADGGGGSSFCNTSTAAYDSFRAGLSEDGTGLEPFCVRVNSFEANYLDSGEANAFQARIDYQYGASLASNTWQPYNLKVNDPLRVGGERVYLLGHGYAPEFTVTFPNGETRTDTVQFKPADPTTLLSEGALRFDPPAGMYPNVEDRRRNQIAIEGLFAPTADLNGTLLGSSFPGMRDPAVAVDIYKGDSGLDSGKPSSIFSLDPQLAASGRLVKQKRVNLKPGESVTLSDGTKVQFGQVKQWVSLQTAHDPGQVYVLVFAVTMTLGLLVSLLVKRRRLWVRLVSGPDEDSGDSRRTVVQFGGLARTDQAGWGEEFATLTTELLAPPESDSPELKDGRNAH
ncbi:MAG: cytochrome c biogenesis protein ResB [Mycobacteriaceae bacterium]